MKKIIAMLLAVMLMAGLVACGETATAETTAAAAQKLEATPEEALTNIWSKFAEEEKFPTFGGDPTNMVDGAPGKFDLADTDGLTFTLLVPAEQVENLAAAASLVHGMLTNNFTCGMFQLKEGVDSAAFVEAMKTSVTGNQWMCGMPETLIIATLGDSHVMVAFGLNDAITPLKTHLAEAYPEAAIVVEQALAG